MTAARSPRYLAHRDAGNALQTQANIVFRSRFEEECPMATIKDVSIFNWNKVQARPVESGLERTICGPDLCGSKFLTVHHRTVSKGRRLDVNAGSDFHLVYVIEAAEGTVSFNGKSHAAEAGAGVLLVP